MEISKKLLEFINVTEQSAIACYEQIGLGNEKAADEAATESMRNSLNLMNINAEIAIGEGERDEAPMLYIGEKLGLNGDNAMKVEIAVDPLEGTTICAKGANGALSVMAIAPEGGFLKAPDTYMEKIAIGPVKGHDKFAKIINFNASIKINLEKLAAAKNCQINDLTAIVLERPRHAELIAEIRSCGAKVKLIQDGDVSAIVEMALGKSNADIYFGAGGAPEGVLAASAMKFLGGQFFGKLFFRTEIEKERAKKSGILDFDKIYDIDELVKKPAIFVASAVTNGEILSGLKRNSDSSFEVNSLFIDGVSKQFGFLSNVKKN